MEKGAQSYPGQVLAAGGMRAAHGQDTSPRAGRQMSTGGTQVAHGWDAGGTLSHPVRLLEVSLGQRQEALCKPPPCLTLLN